MEFEFYTHITSFENEYYIVGKTRDIKRLIGTMKRSNQSGKNSLYGERFIDENQENTVVLVNKNYSWYRFIHYDVFLDMVKSGEIIECEKSDTHC